MADTRRINVDTLRMSSEPLDFVQLLDRLDKLKGQPVRVIVSENDENAAPIVRLAGVLGEGQMAFEHPEDDESDEAWSVAMYSVGDALLNFKGYAFEAAQAVEFLGSSRLVAQFGAVEIELFPVADDD